MAKILLTFNDGTGIGDTVVEFITGTVDDPDDLNELANYYSSEYTKDTNIKEVDRKFVYGQDEETLEEMSQQEANDVIIDLDKKDVQVEPDDVNPLTEDEEYMATKLIAFGGEHPVEGYPHAKDMSEEDFLEYLKVVDYEICLLYLKRNVMEFNMDSPIKGADPEKILNVLGHQNRFATFNEISGKWQSMVQVRDYLIMAIADTQLGAVLRNVIASTTGTLYNNEHALVPIVKTWCKLNNQNVDPRKRNLGDVNKAAEALGTSVEEIEQILASVDKEEHTEH